MRLQVQCPSAAGTLSGLSDVDAEAYDNHGGATSALGEIGQAIDQAIASMTLAAEHADYDVPKPPRSLKVCLLFLPCPPFRCTFHHLDWKINFQLQPLEWSAAIFVSQFGNFFWKLSRYPHYDLVCYTATQTNIRLSN